MSRRYIRSKATEHMLHGAVLLLLAPLLLGLAWFNVPMPWAILPAAVAVLGLVKGVRSMRRAMLLFDRAETEGRDG